MNDRLLVILVSIFVLPAVSRAEAPRYRWQSNAQFVYQVRITADTPLGEETMTGHVVFDVLSATEPFKVKYKGGLTKATKPKTTGTGAGRPFAEGPFGPRFLSPMAANPFDRPVNPFQGLEQTTNEVVVSPTGQILGLTGTSQLPYLLGNLSTYFFEPLPESDLKSWKVEGGIAITEKGEQRSRDRFDPFAGNRESTPDKQFAASETISLTYKSTKNGLLIYDREYKLNSPSATKSLAIDGRGEWAFNPQLGMSESLDFKQTLRVKIENIEFTIPMTVKYERLSPQVWARLEKDRIAREDALRAMAEQRTAEERAAAEAPITGSERSTVLASLASGQPSAIAETLEKLRKKSPRDDAEIAKVIQTLVSHQDVKVQGLAKEVLAKFSPSYKRVYDLNRAYQLSYEVAEVGAWITYDTPLPAGLIVAANSFHNEETVYFPATIVQPLDNGLVRVKYQDKGSFTEERLREDIFLPPPEVEQPSLNADQLATLRAYEAKIKQSVEGSPDLEKLIRSYRDSKKPVLRVGDAVPAGMPLPKFLVVAAKRNNEWWQAHISKELADGKVALRFSGERSDATLPRSDLRLPPPEVIEPNVVPPYQTPTPIAKAPAAASAHTFRTWSDSSGTFKIEAKFVEPAGDGVRLMRKDGKLVVVPLTRLSDADRHYVQSLVKPTNPFEP